MEYTVRLNNNGTENGPNFNRNFKRHLKVAMNQPVTFNEERDARIIDQLIELMNNTLKHRDMRHKGDYDPFYLDNLNKNTLKKLLHSGIGKVYSLSSENRRHIIQFNLERDKQVFGLFLGADDYAYKYGLRTLMDYQLIQKYKSENKAFYNMGSIPHSRHGLGLAEYKHSAGAEPLKVYGIYSHFISAPYRYVNPIYDLGRKIKTTKHIGFISNMVSSLLSLFHLS